MPGLHRVTVAVEPPYTVTIGPGLLENCGPLLAKTISPCRAVVVTDTNVEPLYLSRTKASLEAAGFAVSAFTFPAGEESKNLTTLGELLEFLAAEHLTRTDCLVALGGGVTGDVTGFAAGCYLRGIRYVQLPTTLLAAVDSSVGGKTAVNLCAGKNLAGLFLQPAAVLCDTHCLDTLPDAVFSDGLAEAVKTGVLSDESLFQALGLGRGCWELPELIARCVAFKAEVVARDPLEQGSRRCLNLGHTPAHSIETLSGYQITHGQAVAMGMVLMARAAERLGWCQTPCSARIAAVLTRCGLPVETPYSAGNLAQAALSDKKRAGDSITLVVPQGIGAWSLKTVPTQGLEGIFRAGLEA